MDIVVSLDNVFSAPCGDPMDNDVINPNNPWDIKGNVCMAGKFLCDKTGINRYTSSNTYHKNKLLIIKYKCKSIDNPGVCQGDPVIKCVCSIHLWPFQPEFAHKGHNYHQCTALMTQTMAPPPPGPDPTPTTHWEKWFHDKIMSSAQLKSGCVGFCLVQIYGKSPVFRPASVQNPVEKSQCATGLNPFIVFYLW